MQLRALGILLLLGFMLGCAKARRAESEQRSPQSTCEGRKAIVVDSGFAVVQAITALEGFLSPASNVVPSSVDRVKKGFLVSLVPVHPRGTGGGGLVWVDEDNGCAIVLRR